MADVLDVLIVGGGAAGYTAGIFAARDTGATIAGGAKRVEFLSDRSPGVSY